MENMSGFHKKILSDLENIHVELARSVLDADKYKSISTMLVRVKAKIRRYETVKKKKPLKKRLLRLKN